LSDHKKKQRKYYSGKKKRHTFKTQLVVNKNSREIVAVEVRNGRVHDFRIFKESGVHIPVVNPLIVDSGYQGSQKIHGNTQLPKKKKKKQKLSKEDKRANKQLASDRVINEHINGLLKRFKVFAERYRNRRKRFGLRVNLLAGIYNFEIDK
jgi:hypothetical protein